MRFHYEGHHDPPTTVSIGVRTDFPVDENGEFVVENEDDSEYVAEETPHTPLFSDGLTYRQLQLVAGRFDDVSGNLGEDELREALQEVTADE